MKIIKKIWPLSLSLLLILIPMNLFGGVEPTLPCEGATTGPAITGILTLENRGDVPEQGGCTMMVNFLGMCNLKPVVKKFCFPVLIPEEEGGFNAITADNLIYFNLGDGGPPDCKSMCGGELIYITDVLSFHRYHDRIIARVIMKFLECQ